jgi:hypothetical protein
VVKYKRPAKPVCRKAIKVAGASIVTVARFYIIGLDVPFWDLNSGHDA